MPKLNLTRQQLAAFCPDHQTIRAFEQIFEQVDTVLPDTGDEANNNANLAIAAAQAALSAISDILGQLQLVLNAPMVEPVFPEDYAPAIPYGTIAYQNADAVDITGGTIAGVTISAGSGNFSSISVSGQITSTLATGTAPFVVASTTKVANLNADLLDGADWASPAAIGSTTPSSGNFTSITTSAGATIGDATSSKFIVLNGSNSGTGGGAAEFIRNNGVNVIALGNKSGILGTAYDATPYIFAPSQIEIAVGIKVPGGAQFLSTSSALTNGAGAGAGTITNAPAAGNPTKWIAINDNGTLRYIPSW